MEEKKELFEKATHDILKIFSGPSDKFIKKILNEPVHLQQAQELRKTARKVGYVSPQLLQLKVCIFECLMGPLRNFEEAKIIIEEIEEDLKAGFELDPYYMALFKINKGFFECVYHINYEEAIRFMDEGLAILTPLREYKEERLRAIANLAQYYALRGEMGKANEYIIKGKDFLTDSLSGPYYGFFLFVWSLVLNDQGKFQDSLDVLAKAHAYPTLNVDYPTLDHSLLFQRAGTLINQGRLEEAEKILEECEKKLNDFFQGRKNTTLANVLVFKSLLLINKKKPSPEACQYALDAIKIYDDFLQNDKKHRYHARAHLTLGKAHTLNNNAEEALKEYLLSEDIFNSVLKEKTIDEVSELYKELATLGADIKDDEIAHTYLKAHIDTFGVEHPRTKEITHYLDER